MSLSWNILPTRVIVMWHVPHLFQKLCSFLASRCTQQTCTVSTIEWSWHIFFPGYLIKYVVTQSHYIKFAVTVRLPIYKATFKEIIFLFHRCSWSMAHYGWIQIILTTKVTGLSARDLYFSAYNVKKHTQYPLYGGINNSKGSSFIH